MSKIRRINYRKQDEGLPDFEMVDLHLFFSTTPSRMLERDFRLNFWVLLYITEGTGVHYVDFHRLEYKPGDVLFIQKNQVQKFAVNMDVRGYILHINEPFLVSLNQYGKNIFLEFIDRSGGSPVISVNTDVSSTNRKLIDLLFSEYSRGHKNVDEEFIKSLFDSFILSLRQEFKYVESVFTTSDYRIFSEFREIVEAHYMEHLTLDHYAERMGVSKKTINKATRAVVDLSAKEFANNRLFLEIKRYLSQGELLIYEISDMLGFDEPSNMTKFFKKHEGTSPKLFQQSLLDK